MSRETEKAIRFGVCMVLLPGLQAMAQPRESDAAQAADTRKAVELPREFRGQPVPKWENGYFFGFTVEASVPKVYAYTGGGAKLFEVDLSIDGAMRVNVGSMAASRTGVFAVAGSAAGATGEGGTFLAFLDVGGRMRRLARLDRFAPLHLAFGPDDRLWVAGRATNYPSREEPADHDILRIYDREGRLTTSVLARGNFAAGRAHPATRARLAGNQEVMMLLCPEYHELVALSPEGQVLSRRRYELPEGPALVTGFAVAPDNGVYLSGQVRRDRSTTEEFVFYRWNDGGRRWEPVYGRKATERSGYHAVFGFDEGLMLVSTALPKFEWIPPLAR